MSFKLHQEPQVQPRSTAEQLQMQLDHLKRTVASPHDLVEHIIQLYGAEFTKANECIAKLNSDADLLARSKQLVEVANRDLMHDIRALRMLVTRILRELPVKRDWLDPDLEKAMQSVAKTQALEQEQQT